MDENTRYLELKISFLKSIRSSMKNVHSGFATDATQLHDSGIDQKVIQQIPDIISTACTELESILLANFEKYCIESKVYDQLLARDASSCSKPLLSAINQSVRSQESTLVPENDELREEVKILYKKRQKIHSELEDNLSALGVEETNMSLAKAKYPAGSMSFIS